MVQRGRSESYGAGVERGEDLRRCGREEVLGFVAIKPLNEKALEILWIAVRRELRGKGIGTELLHFVEDWARERGFQLLVVKSSGDLSYKPYDATRKFYERRGFARIARIDPYPEWGEPVLIYAKCLKRK